MEAPQIHSRAEFARALVWGMEAAMEQRSRRIVCADPDFEHWPLDEPRLIDRLTTWLRLPQRQLVLLAARYDTVPRASPRFTTWRRDWTHAVAAWRAPPECHANLPSVLCNDSGISVQLIDALHWRGRAADDARRAQQWRDQLDALLQRSEPAFASQVLGL